VNRAIWRKALADTRTHRLQSALIFIILVAASAALALSLIVQQNADKPWRKAFDEANGAHLVFFGRDASVDLSPIASVEGVTDADGPFPTVLHAPLIADGLKFEANVFGVNAEPPRVGRPLLEDGRWLNAGASSEIVLERSYADYVGVGIGDTVRFKAGDAFVPLTVVGTVIDTGRGPYPDWNPGHAWVLRETLPLLESGVAPLGSMLAVRVENPEASEEVAFNAFSALSSPAHVSIIDWHDAEDDLTGWNRIYAVFLGVFSAFAMLAVGLIIANAIGGRVLAQFREIGLLKATGFTPRQVAGIYLVQHLALALVGSLIGLGVALSIAPIYLRQMAETFNTTTETSIDPLLSTITVVAILVAVTVFTLLPAWRGGRVSTVQAITTGFTPVSSRTSMLARLALRLHLPTAVGVGVKDAFARPGRAVLTIVALSLTIVTITFTLGMEAMFGRILHDRGLVEEPWDIEVVRGEASDADIRRVLDTNPGVASYATSNWMRAKVASTGDGDPREFDLRSLGADTEHSDYPMIEGRMLAAPGEAIAGRMLFDELGLRIGDQLSMEALLDPFDTSTRRPLTVTVVGKYVEPEDGGHVVLFSAESAEQLFPGLQPETYEVMMRDGADWNGLIAELHAATDFSIDIDQVERGTPGELTTMRGISFGLTTILLIIGVANMLTTTLLNVRERVRDIGILKSLGMTPRQVVGSVASGVSLLTLLATGVGIPLGLVVYRVLFTIVGENMADADPALYTPPSWVGLALVVPGALVFAALSSIVPARRAAAVQVTEVLRYE
jgi:putative ABC transport system permease protein